MRLRTDHEYGSRLERAGRPHACCFCGCPIPVGMLHVRRHNFSAGPPLQHGHDLCERSESVEPHHSLPIGWPVVGELNPEFGTIQWLRIMQRSAPPKWFPCVWPPDLHGWLISLPPIEWSTR